MYSGPMKRVVICGAGEIGKNASEVLVQEGHDVTVVDTQAQKLEAIFDQYDVSTVTGSCCLPNTMKLAKFSECDVLIAATNSDEINLLTATVGKQMGIAHVIARIHERDFLDSSTFNFGKNLGIDTLICPEKITSEKIVANITDTSILDFDHFERHDIEVYRYKIPHIGEFVGKPLKDLKLPLGVRVAVIDREGLAFLPNANSQIKVGDIVTFISSSGQFKQTQSLFNRHLKRPEAKNIAIVGCTSMTRWLIDDFSKMGFHIKLFESKLAIAEEYSEDYPHITVINSDVSNPAQLREEQVGQCAAFITVTESDELNILSALQAKRLGVELTAAIVHKATYLNLLGNIGIDLPFSPRLVAAKELLNLISDKPIKFLATLAQGVAVLYEVSSIQGHSIGKHLKALQMPRDSFIASITRGQRMIIPTAEESLHQADDLIIVGPPHIEQQLRRLFKP